MARIEDLIERVDQPKFISSLDLYKSYWKVPLTEAAKPLTAFRTPPCLQEFTQMPLQGGTCNLLEADGQGLGWHELLRTANPDDIAVYNNS